MILGQEESCTTKTNSAISLKTVNAKAKTIYQSSDQIPFSYPYLSSSSSFSSTKPPQTLLHSITPSSPVSVAFQAILPHLSFLSIPPGIPTHTPSCPLSIIFFVATRSTAPCGIRPLTFPTVSPTACFHAAAKTFHCLLSSLATSTHSHNPRHKLSILV